jgi:hypothetical protein
MTNEGKGVGLLCHNIQKCNTQLSRKKTSVSNDRIYRLLYDKASENNKNYFINNDFEWRNSEAQLPGSLLC